jgi:hypothetical protein
MYPEDDIRRHPEEAPGRPGGKRMAMDKRVEVLFPRVEYEELKAEARRRGVSLGELIRDTMRRSHIRPSKEEREAALDRLINAPPIDIGTWEEVKPLIGRYVDKEP